MDSNSLESLWENLLSRQADQIHLAFNSLPLTERRAVVDHLQRMAHDPGWQPEQRLSAEAALSALAGEMPEENA